MNDDEALTQSSVTDFFPSSQDQTSTPRTPDSKTPSSSAPTGVDAAASAWNNSPSSTSTISLINNNNNDLDPPSSPSTLVPPSLFAPDAAPLTIPPNSDNTISSDDTDAAKRKRIPTTQTKIKIKLEKIDPVVVVGIQPPTTMASTATPAAKRPKKKESGASDRRVLFSINGNVKGLLTPKKKPTGLPCFDPISSDNIFRAYDKHQKNRDPNKKTCCTYDVFAYCTTKSPCQCLRAGSNCRDCCSYNSRCLNREDPIPSATTTTKNNPRTKQTRKPNSWSHDKARGGFLFRSTTPAAVAAGEEKIRGTQSSVAAALSKQIDKNHRLLSLSDDEGIIGVIRTYIETNNTTNTNKNTSAKSSAVGGSTNPITVVEDGGTAADAVVIGRGVDRVTGTTADSDGVGRGADGSGRIADRTRRS